MTQFTQEMYDSLETEEFNRKLSDSEKLERLKECKGTPLYEGWTPYCLAEGCTTMPRTVNRDFGFECPSCKNKIGFNGTRLKESPLNRKFWTN